MDMTDEGLEPSRLLTGGFTERAREALGHITSG